MAICKVMETVSIQCELAVKTVNRCTAHIHVGPTLFTSDLSVNVHVSSDQVLGTCNSQPHRMKTSGTPAINLTNHYEA